MGLVPVIEDWHTKLILFEGKILYHVNQFIDDIIIR